MSTSKINPKVTDKQFIEAFITCEGNYSKTANYIEEHFNVVYSKQAVYKRAQNFPEECKKILEPFGGLFTEKLIPFAGDESTDIRLRIKIYMYLQNKISKYRRLKAITDKASNKKSKRVHKKRSHIIHSCKKHEEQSNSIPYGTPQTTSLPAN